MKKLCLLSLVVFPLMALQPEEPLPAGFEHWTPASLQTVTQALSTQAAGNPYHVAARQLSDYPNESFSLVRREADGQAEWHETQIDIIFVQSGSATLVVGGKLIEAETLAPHEKRGAAIEGGARQRLSAGDVVRIPPRTPHQLLLDGAREFTYIVIKGKRY